MPCWVSAFRPLPKTWYVGKEGDDNPDCGGRTSPCETINQALGLADTNDKIVVGPGRYMEFLEIDIEGLKLESTAGRWGTIIETTDSDDHVISIGASRVQIGRKGKGFTLQGAIEPAAAGIYLYSFSGLDRIRIEGNRITENSYGIYIQNFVLAGTVDERAAYQSKLQIRYNNVVRNTGNYAILCGGCGGSLIADNRIEDNGHGTGFGDALNLAASSKVAIYRNVITHNAWDAFFGDGSQQARIKDNVVDKSSAYGLTVSNGDGSVVQSNILAQNTVYGLALWQTTNNIRALQAKNNLAVANVTNNILIYSEGQAILFDGNTSVDSASNGIDITGAMTTLGRFRSNNAIGSNYGINLPTGVVLKHERQFFENNACDLCGTGAGDVDPTSTEATKPNPLKVNKARSL